MAEDTATGKTLSGTVKLPFVGTVKKKYIAIGLAATAGAIVITLYRRRQAGTSGATAAANAFTDPAGNQCAAPNPLTGFCPGTPDDLAAQAQLAVNTGSQQSGSGSGSDGGTVGGEVQNGPPFSSNPAWAQYVTTYLVDTTGRNAQAVSTAIGDYLSGTAVDTPEEDIIHAANAYGGPPPVAGAGGFPPSIRHKGTKGGGKTFADNPVKGLKASGVMKTVADLDWQNSAHAASYEVTISHAGRRVRHFDVAESKTKITGLTPGTHYTATVLARPPKSSAHGATVAFTTHKK
jgi:hypothetical protein